MRTGPLLGETGRVAETIGTTLTDATLEAHVEARIEEMVARLGGAEDTTKAIFARLRTGDVRTTESTRGVAIRRRGPRDRRTLASRATMDLLLRTTDSKQLRIHVR